MKILCVIDSLGSGGAQRQLVNLAIGFKEHGYEVNFLVYHNANFYYEELEKVNIPVHQIIESNFLKRVLKMRKFIRGNNYGVVISFLEPPSFICELASLPLRKWEHIVGERSSDPKIMNSFKRRIFRWFHLLADHVVANSHENAAMVRKIVPVLPKKKCHVIYNFVDETKWKPSDDYVPLKSGKLHLIVAASHQYLKNAKGLVEAVNQLSAENQSKIIVDWYGDKSPDNSYLEIDSRVEELNLKHIICFHNATSLIYEKVINADAVGLFSFYEGLPNIICESMTAGKAIIASDVSDLSRFLDRELLFTPTDVDQIKHRIEFLISLTPEELKRIGNQNRENAKLLFQKKAILTQYINLFKGDS